MRNTPERTATATIGNEIKFSLGTADTAVAKARTAIATAHVARTFKAVRGGASKLSHKAIVALSGDVYRLFIDKFADNPGERIGWTAVKAFNHAARKGLLLGQSLKTEPDETNAAIEHFGTDFTAGLAALSPPPDASAMEHRFGWLVNWVLSINVISVDYSTRLTLLAEVDRAVTQAAVVLKRHGDGDYAPDPNANRFPVFEPDGPTTIEDLLAKWANESARSVSAMTTWRTVTRSLIAHLGHNDVNKISPRDIVGWKDKLVAAKLSAKTINDSYLAALNSLFNFDVKDTLLVVNPAAGVGVSGKRPAGTGRQKYTTEEVAQLLSIARQSGSEQQKWLIWLAASSGARIGEIAQLWGENIMQVGSVPLMHLKPAPDAGSLKNESSER